MLRGFWPEQQECPVLVLLTQTSTAVFLPVDPRVEARFLACPDGIGAQADNYRRFGVGPDSSVSRGGLIIQLRQKILSLQSLATHPARPPYRNQVAINVTEVFPDSVDVEHLEA